MSKAKRRTVAMVLSGGAGLGAYQAGAYSRMHEVYGDQLGWIAGSSIGAVNGAVIAGSEPHRRVEQLARFWEQAAVAMPAAPAMAARSGGARHAASWLGALQARTAGSGLFRPRFFPELLSENTLSIYEPSPLRDKLARFVDFDRLNQGALRLSVVTTDIATGEAVVFDTAAGSRIEPAHIIASSGLLPDFQPVEIDGRLLGDGSLVEHAPAGVVLGGRREEEMLCFLVDAFSRTGPRPTSLERAAERRLDLMMTAQTDQVLSGLEREHALRRHLAEALERLPVKQREDPKLAPALAEARQAGATVLYLSYRAAPEEAGPEKQFDFSPASLGDRWAAGAKDMQAALDLLPELPRTRAKGGFSVHRIGG